MQVHVASECVCQFAVCESTSNKRDHVAAHQIPGASFPSTRMRLQLTCIDSIKAAQATDTHGMPNHHSIILCIE